jgi:hypothetical protein
MRGRQIGSTLPGAFAVAALIGLVAPSAMALGAGSRKPTLLEGMPSTKRHQGARQRRPTANRGPTAHARKRKHAKTAPPIDVLSSPELWATVDVCNAPDQPDTVGIRGSMPGDGDPKDDMYIRFQVQYLQIATHAWTNLSQGGESTWMNLGPSSGVRQAGQTFQFGPPPAETASFTLRGMVDFQWRRGRKVIQSATEITTAGHKSLAGADPAGFSAASCQIP